MKIEVNPIMPSHLRSAFKKLQAAAYFDNYDLLLREKIANYKLNIEENLNHIFRELGDQNPI